MTTQIKGNDTSTFGGAITANNVGAGNVLQVINVEFSSQVTATNSTFQDTGLEASITPSSTSSKIFVLVNAAGVGKDTNNTWAWFRILKNGSVYKTAGTFHGYTASTSPLSIGSVVSSTLDSPNTTSPLTYKLQIATGNLNNVYMNIASGNDRSSITLMEVAG